MYEYIGVYRKWDYTCICRNIQGHTINELYNVVAGRFWSAHLKEPMQVNAFARILPQTQTYLHRSKQIRQYLLTFVTRLVQICTNHRKKHCKTIEFFKIRCLDLLFREDVSSSRLADAAAGRGMLGVRWGARGQGGGVYHYYHYDYDYDYYNAYCYYYYCYQYYYGTILYYTTLDYVRVYVCMYLCMYVCVYV